MRFNIKVELGESFLPLEYRRMILSILKKSFENSSNIFFEELYKDNVNLRAFVFSVFLKNPEFRKNGICLEGNEIAINFSTSDYKVGILLYNGLLKTKEGKSFYSYRDENGIDYEARIISVYVDKREKKNFSSDTIFKTLSPLVVRKHNEKNNKDFYLLPEDDGFERLLFENTKLKVEKFLRRELKKDEIKFEVFKGYKKIPVKHYGRYVESIHGLIKISGDKDVVKLLYQVGFGSKNGQGFGMLEVV